MRKTDIMREQHSKLLQIVAALSSILDLQSLTQNPENAFQLLSELTSRIDEHLHKEDTCLYPMLHESQDLRVRQLAMDFEQEMGPIKDMVKCYSSHWPSEDAILNNPKGFAEESRIIFFALGERIMREDNSLYAMVDKL